MSELLSFDDLEQGYTTPESSQYPGYTVYLEDESCRSQGTWHDVHANGAQFLVKISHPVFVEIEVAAYLSEPLCHVNKNKTWGKLFGIEVEEVMGDYDIVPVSEDRQMYYESSLSDDTTVLLMGLTQKILPNADTI